MAYKLLFNAIGRRAFELSNDQAVVSGASIEDIQKNLPASVQVAWAQNWIELGRAVPL